MLAESVYQPTWLFDPHALADAPLKTCVHCGELFGRLYRRNLCWHCYSRPRIRDKHAPILECGMGALHHDQLGDTSFPDFAVDARPGTEGKLAVMAARYADRKTLHHPHDWTEDAAEKLRQAEEDDELKEMPLQRFVQEYWQQLQSDDARRVRRAKIVLHGLGLYDPEAEAMA